METHELEVMIPENHRLTVEVPKTIRSGPARLILVVPAEDETTPAPAREPQAGGISPPDCGTQAAEGARPEEIDRLYAELRELMTRAGAGDGRDEQIRDRFSRLRKLQEEEADAIEVRFRARHRLRPGEGYQALERARQIIGDEDPT